MHTEHRFPDYFAISPRGKKLRSRKRTLKFLPSRRGRRLRCPRRVSSSGVCRLGQRLLAMQLLNLGPGEFGQQFCMGLCRFLVFTESGATRISSSGLSSSIIRSSRNARSILSSMGSMFIGRGWPSPQVRASFNLDSCILPEPSFRCSLGLPCPRLHWFGSDGSYQGTHLCVLKVAKSSRL